MAKMKKGVQREGTDASADAIHGEGSTFAPTEQAAKAEAQRHAEEEAHGHLAAGVNGRTKAVDKPTKKRAQN